MPVIKILHHVPATIVWIEHADDWTGIIEVSLANREHAEHADLHKVDCDHLRTINIPVTEFVYGDNRVCHLLPAHVAFAVGVVVAREHAKRWPNFIEDDRAGREPYVTDKYTRPWPCPFCKVPGGIRCSSLRASGRWGGDGGHEVHVERLQPPAARHLADAEATAPTIADLGAQIDANLASTAHTAVQERNAAQQRAADLEIKVNAMARRLGPLNPRTELYELEELRNFAEKQHDLAVRERDKASRALNAANTDTVETALETALQRVLLRTLRKKVIRTKRRAPDGAW